MPSVRPRPPAALAAACILLAVLIVAAHEPQALSLLPLLGLGVLLLTTRRYPGERLLAALQARRSGRVRTTRRLTAPRVGAARTPRGGLLIASSLAVRPPPALAAAR
jgi:hypothetical protein